MPAIFDTYRFDGNGDLARRIQNAVRDFHTRRGALPGLLVVHKSETDQARAIVGAGLEVRGVGGCLVGEVWVRLQEPLPELDEPATPEQGQLVMEV